MTENSEAELRAQLADQYRRVGELKLNELASGNLSCRLGEGMLISPTGASAEDITSDSIVYVAPDGSWEGKYRPSSEWQMHAAIYREYEQAKAVVHTHSDYCVAVSCHNRSLPGFHYLVGMFGGNDVPCVPYSTYGGVELAENTARAMRGRNACLLGSHGMICHGPNLSAAVLLAQRLEIMCRQYTIACSLGTPYELTSTQWSEFFERATGGRYGKSQSAAASS